MEEKLSNASTFNADDQIKYTRLAEVTGLYDKYKEEAAVSIFQKNIKL